MSSTFRSVLFDLDGTLHDRHATITRYLRSHVARFGHPEGFVQRFTALDDFGYRSKREVFETLTREFNLPTSTDELLQDYDAHGWDECRLMPYAHEVLDDLRAAGVRIGIVTNGWPGKQQACLDALDLTRRADAVIISKAVGVTKPHRDIYTLALDALDVSAHETLFVGDSPVNDVAGPQAAGLRAAYLPTGHTLPENVLPDFTLTDLRDVHSIVLGRTFMARGVEV
ncbi:HAD family hydrolase (plasmid) [Deinococcus radiomollis]|uniref:HAD family hydrolase n=1 Tax=Deinococcus radiomollis TaxID=468916 RepID=UPI003891F250